jgi:hypothetical protein
VKKTKNFIIKTKKFPHGGTEDWRVFEFFPRELRGLRGLREGKLAPAPADRPQGMKKRNREVVLSIRP